MSEHGLTKLELDGEAIEGLRPGIPVELHKRADGFPGLEVHLMSMPPATAGEIAQRCAGTPLGEPPRRRILGVWASGEPSVQYRIAVDGVRVHAQDSAAGPVAVLQIYGESDSGRPAQMGSANTERYRVTKIELGGKPLQPPEDGILLVSATPPGGPISASLSFPNSGGDTGGKAASQFFNSLGRSNAVEVWAAGDRKVHLTGLIFCPGEMKVVGCHLGQHHPRSDGPSTLTAMIIDVRCEYSNIDAGASAGDPPGGQQ